MTFYINFNQVNFGNTDGASGQRVDFEQGRLPENSNYFYMSTGGYANAPKKNASTTNLQTDKSVVESLDLSKFLERVDEAIRKEKVKNDSIKNIKNNVPDYFNLAKDMPFKIKIVKLLEEMGNTFKMLLAIMCSVSVMLIVGTTLVLKITNSGLMYR